MTVGIGASDPVVVAASMVGAPLFVTCVHFEQSAGLVAGDITAGSAGTLWGALPLARRRTPSRSRRMLKSPAYPR
jgi:hypothetical protein